MTHVPIKMTRIQFQTEALAVQCLLEASMALFSADSTDDAYTLTEMAFTRAKGLNCALDCVNEPDLS